MTGLTPEILLQAYASGIFPMAESRHDPELHWIAPKQRGIIPLDGFHVSRALARKIRRRTFAVRVDSAFGAVIEGCAEPSAERRDTWINDTIIDLYTRLHDMGYAHSVECWRDGALAGGLYGISLGAAFFGESMFTRVSDASKVALTYLVARMRHGGYRLLDVQFLTDHLAGLGAIAIPRAEYQRRLKRAQAASADFYSLSEETAAETVLQLVTQMS